MAADPYSIRMIVSDLDGVWTDGRIIYSGEIRETKEFNVRDGLGVKLAQGAGIDVAVLTSRKSKAVERRCAELGIRRVVQGASDKLVAMMRLLEESGLSGLETIYVGDDLPDLAPMRMAGITAAPADAAAEVHRFVTWKLAARGGEGALREVVERLLRERGEWDAIVERFHGAELRHPSV